jgi:hypothetical protein
MSFKFNDSVRIGGLTPGVVLMTGVTVEGNPCVGVATARGNYLYPAEWLGTYRNTPEHDAIRAGK